jgi:hypothetical protein
MQSSGLANWTLVEGTAFRSVVRVVVPAVLSFDDGLHIGSISK